jgi:hypothetical protein
MELLRKVPLMSDLSVSLLVVALLVLAAGTAAMATIGLVGVLSGKRLIVPCPGCGRWRFDRSGRGQTTLCMHCVHPAAFAWEPSVLHPHGQRVRPHRVGPHE